MTRCYDYVVSEKGRALAEALDEIASELERGKAPHLMSDRIAQLAVLAKQ